MLQITLIAFAIPAAIIGSFLLLWMLVWKDAGSALYHKEFKRGNPMSCLVGKRFYRVIQYGLIAAATGAWTVLGYQVLTSA